jgi:hypothetical protein
MSHNRALHAPFLHRVIANCGQNNQKNAKGSEEGQLKASTVVLLLHLEPPVTKMPGPKAYELLIAPNSSTSVFQRFLSILPISRCTFIMLSRRCPCTMIPFKHG